MQAFEENPYVREVVLDYSTSVPETRENPDGTIENGFELSCDSLPINKDLFWLSDRLVCGSYFTQANQVILNYATGMKLAGSEKELSGLIGKTIPIDFYDGVHDMTITGVFPRFSERQYQYMLAAGCIPDEINDHKYYINSAFSNKYLADPAVTSRAHQYVVYFDTFRHMKDACEEMDIKFPYETIFTYTAGVEYSFLFEVMFQIIYPMLIVILLLAALFYFQTQRTEARYNRHIFAVYQYLGYPMREIKRCWVFSSLMQVAAKTALALGIALPVMLAINIINQQTEWLPFQIFTFRWELLAAVAGFMLVLSVLLSLYTVRKIRMVGWHKILLQQRDLI